MIPDLYKIVDCGDGFLAIMPRPGPEEWLRDEIAELCNMGVTTLVSLLEEAEERDLGLSLEAGIAAENDIEFLSYPIEDRTIPADLHGFTVFTRGLAQRVLEGGGVAIHCRAGIGRSGITAAAVMVRIGFEPDKVFARLSEARRCPVPDTYEQLQWFDNHHTVFLADLDADA